MDCDNDIARELKAHLDLETETQAQQGLAAKDAREAALRAFGNPALVTEQVRDVSPWVWWDRLRQDLRYGLRAIRRNPGFAAVVVASLGLGIGANTAIFSILNTLVLKTLPVREPQQLAVLDHGSWTNPIWEQIRARQDDIFDGAFAWSTARFDLSERGQTDPVDGAYASGRMFDVLGVQPAIGRFFTAADDDRRRAAPEPVAVIGHGLWQQRFGGRTDVIGKTITIEHVPFTIVGVMPSDFFGPDVGRKLEVVVPLADEAFVRGKDSALDGGWTWWLEIMVRLKPGHTLDQASQAFHTVQPLIREAARPSTGPPGALADYLKEPFTLIPAASGKSDLRTRYKEPLTIIMVVVAVVLFIACANIANLVLARASARRHELTVRLALGASRWRLARQLLTESAILGAFGAVLGVIVANWGAAALVGQLGTTVTLDLSTDWRVLAFTSGVALATVLLFGLAPAVTVGRLAPNDALKEQSRSIAGDRRFGLRNTLVVMQVASSVTLVVGAFLFLRTFVSLTSVPLGFDPKPLLLTTVNIQQLQVPPEQRAAVFQAIEQAAAIVPGVSGASFCEITPVSGQGWNNQVRLPGSSSLSEVDPVPRGPNRDRMTWINAVSPGWFATLQTRLVAGRDFDGHDRDGSPRVAIVNEAFVQKYFNGQNPIGRDIGLGIQEVTRYQVVGIASNAVYRRLREGAVPTVYRPFAQEPGLPASMTLIVRAQTGAPAALSHSLAVALGRANPQAAFTFRAMSSLMRSSMTQERIVAILSTSFGLLALLLATIGLYGVTSYSVNRRRAEIGIRMALGARPGRVIRLVLGRVGWLVCVGVVGGGLLSYWAAHYIAASLLFGIQPRDPSALAIAVVVLMAVGAFAGWLPARRAAHIDPLTVLREN